MLLLNIEQLLKTRGVDNASRYLVQQGMKYHTINRLLTRKIDKMTHATVEQLCLLCNCCPNDLFVWQPGNNAAVAADHPLHALKPKPLAATPVERIKRLSVSKLEKLQEFMDGLERE